MNDMQQKVKEYREAVEAKYGILVTNMFTVFTMMSNSGVLMMMNVPREDRDMFKNTFAAMAATVMNKLEEIAKIQVRPEIFMDLDKALSEHVAGKTSTPQVPDYPELYHLKLQ